MQLFLSILLRPTPYHACSCLCSSPQSTSCNMRTTHKSEMFCSPYLPVTQKGFLYKVIPFPSCLGKVPLLLVETSFRRTSGSFPSFVREVPLPYGRAAPPLSFMMHNLWITFFQQKGGIKEKECHKSL